MGSNQQNSGGYQPSMGGNQANTNAASSNIGAKAPWMRSNKPPISGGATPSDAKIATIQQESNISAIPTLNDDNKKQPFSTNQNNNSDFSSRFKLGGGGGSNADNQSQASQRNAMPFGQPKTDFSGANAIPTLNEQPKNNDFTNKIPTIGGNDDTSKIDAIPTIGESRRRVGAGTSSNNNSVGGYMPSGIEKKTTEKDNTGDGRRRAADPFAKFDNVDPVNKNVAAKHNPFNNNVSGITGNSNKNDLFSNASNRDQKPSFLDKLKNNGNNNEEQEKKPDFWSDFLNKDGEKPAQKAPVPKPAPTQAMMGQPNKPTFQDVADLEEDIMLD